MLPEIRICYASKVSTYAVSASLVDCIRPNNGINRTFLVSRVEIGAPTSGTRPSSISVLSGGQAHDEGDSDIHSFFSRRSEVDLSFCRTHLESTLPRLTRQLRGREQGGTHLGGIDPMKDWTPPSPPTSGTRGRVCQATSWRIPPPAAKIHETYGLSEIEHEKGLPRDS